MNLQELFQMQKALDEKIVREKRLEGQDFTTEKVLALIVELGECANEFRRFKFWSTDQEPRTNQPAYIDCPACDGLRINPMSGDECSECEAFGLIQDGSKNPMLEEYVDCLHFLLSIGLEIEPDIDEDWELSGFTSFIVDDTTEQFIITAQTVAMLRGASVDDDNCYENLMMSFKYLLGLGELLGFTEDQIQAAYLQKNEVNHTRQSNGY